MSRRTWWLLLLAAACGGDETIAPAAPCEPLAVALPDGSCIRPGVPPDGCAAGFAHDGSYGCTALLPEEPCSLGTIAVPGDASCRPVMTCGSGPWGDIPVEPDTVYVDASYTATGDGSAEKPWRTLAEGYAAAPSGAIVAFAAGSYQEDLRIAKPVRLWGVCPEQVELAGDGDYPSTIGIAPGADGSEIHGVAIRGPKRGVLISGCTSVVVDRAWVHATGAEGIVVSSLLGTAEVRVAGTLVEDAGRIGIAVEGADLRLEASVVRRARVVGDAGYGVTVTSCGLFASCAVARRGAVLAMSGSMVDQSEGAAVVVIGSDAIVEASLIRDAGADPGVFGGSGGVVAFPCIAGLGCAQADGALVSLTRSVVERNHGVGLNVIGSRLELEATVVTDTRTTADETFGRGVELRPCTEVEGCVPLGAASADLRRSLVRGSSDVGVLMSGTEMNIDGLVVQDTLPAFGWPYPSGYGVDVRLFCSAIGVCDARTRSNASLRDSLIEDSHVSGLLISSSDATVESTAIRRSKETAGLYGDGVILEEYWGPPASASLRNVLVEESERAGISAFGGTLTLEGNAIRCALFDIALESPDGEPPSIDNLGGNVCGCPEPDHECKARSEGLEPPSPVSD